MELLMEYSYCKVLLLSKDEDLIIEDFILYYGYLFDYKNIIIIDNNSSSQKVIDIYSKYIPLGLTVINDTSQFIYARFFMNNYINMLRDYCEWLFCLETDEFIYWVPEKNSTINKRDIFLYLKSIPANITQIKYMKLMNCCPDPKNIYNESIMNINEFKGVDWDKHIIRVKAFESIILWEHTYKMQHGDILLSNKLNLLHYTNISAASSFYQSKKIAEISIQFSCDFNNIYDLLTCKRDRIHENALNGHRIQQYVKYQIRKFIVAEAYKIKNRFITVEELLIIEKYVKTIEDLYVLIRLIDDPNTEFPNYKEDDLILCHEKETDTEVITQVSKTLKKIKKKL